MSITLKFEDKGYLPGLAHQLVTTLQDSPKAELIGVEEGNQGTSKELVFGLDGAESEDDRLLITDVEVLVAARDYSQKRVPEYAREIMGFARTAAYMIDQQTNPVFASARKDADGQGMPTADA